MSLPDTDQEFDKLILDFESGLLPKNKWHHPDHVVVAVWYLLRFPEDEAIRAISQGIQHLNSHHQVPQTPTSGYHETWTIFFSKILGNFLKGIDQSLPRLEKLHQACDYLKDFKAITLEYYSRDLIMSWEARTTWKEPDLKKLK